MKSACEGACASPAVAADAATQEGMGLGEVLTRLWDTEGFPARWYCGHWSPALGWLHIVSDLAIFGAYLSIPLALGYFLLKRRDLPFPGLLALFGAFILFCGVGHAIEALIFWLPVYRLAGLVKALTAVVSWSTVVVIVRVLPAALRLPELARSESRYALAVLGTDHGIWDWDIASGRVYYSHQFRALLGFEGDEFEPTYAAWESRLHPDDRPRVVAAIEAHLKGDAGYDVEYRLGSKDRGDLWFHSRGQATWDASGTAVRMAGGISNITERKRAVEALRRGEAEARRLALVASRTDNAVVITDEAGRVEWVNEGFTRLTGYRLEEILGRKPGSFLQGPDTDPATVAKVRRRLAEGLGFQVEILNYDRSGRPYWLAIDAQPIRDESGRLTNFIAIESDISERKRREDELRRAHADLRLTHDELEARVQTRTGELREQTEALRRAEEDYRGIFEHAAEGIFQTTPAGCYLRANPALARIYGYDSPAELIADLRDTSQQLYNEPERREEFCRQVERHGTIKGFESRVRRRDGDEIWITEDARVVRDAQGHVVCYEGTVTEITGRKRAEREIRDLNASLRRRLDRIAALRRIDQAIAGGPDLAETLGVVVDQTREQLGVDAAAIRLCGETVRVVGRGLPEGVLDGLRLESGEGVADASVRQAMSGRIDDLAHSEEPAALALRGAGETFSAYRVAPLVAKGRVQGVLEVFQRGPLPEDADWCEYLETLAGQAAIAVDSVEMFEGLQRVHHELELAYDATIEGWARALDLRDKETEGHTRRVTQMSLRLARALGLRGEALAHVRRGALLHDIGKLGVPDAILLKPGKLTDEEWAIMRRHPGYAHEWLSPISFLRPSLVIPYGHHERWDGAGYPRGLAGEAIPLAARLFAAVDIWDALRSDRPYRAAWPEAKVREHLRSLAGNHLDPEVVAAFLRVLDDPEGTDDALESVITAGPECLPTERLEVVEQENHCQAGCRVRELESENARLVELAATDELTGLWNRRHFRAALGASLAEADRHGQALSLVLLDLDGFKAFNDSHGHPAGDGVLRVVAGVLGDQLRPGDVAARHGGEEFAILMPGSDAEGARTCAERLRASIAAYPWPLRAITGSFGVATWTFGQGAAELMEQADRALYDAKRQGRDRVVHADDLAAFAFRGTLEALGVV